MTTRLTLMAFALVVTLTGTSHAQERKDLQVFNDISTR